MAGFALAKPRTWSVAFDSITILPAHSEEKYTTKHTGPWELVWFEKHSDRASAMARARFIKSRKSATWIRKHLLSHRASPDVHRD